MAHDALGAHARDELGISESLSARPVQAAPGVGCQLRGRRGAAAGGDGAGARAGDIPWVVGNIARLPGLAGRG